MADCPGFRIVICHGLLTAYPSGPSTWVVALDKALDAVALWIDHAQLTLRRPDESVVPGSCISCPWIGRKVYRQACAINRLLEGFRLEHCNHVGLRNSASGLGLQLGRLWLGYEFMTTPP